MMTEEEAKTKWCPAVRVYRRTSHDNVDYSETNRGEDTATPTAHNCIGSACMAWRWGQEYEYAETRLVKDNDSAVARALGYMGRIVPPPGDGWERCEGWDQPKHADYRWRRRTRAVGRCGLAGKP
jgi:hypothetical protein